MVLVKPYEIGDRVRFNSFLYKGEGTIFYIDKPNLFVHEFPSIQVEMDEPDGDGHSMKRFNLKEVKPILIGGKENGTN